MFPSERIKYYHLEFTDVLSHLLLAGVAFSYSLPSELVLLHKGLPCPQGSDVNGSLLPLTAMLFDSARNFYFRF